MRKLSFLYFILVSMIYSCKPKEISKTHLIVLDPQHFHAALVQKYSNPLIDSNVKVFSSAEDLTKGYRNFIHQYNTRLESPTNWNLRTYYGHDYLSKAFEDSPGDLVILAGDNQAKINYITAAFKNKKDVFADKPLVIDEEGFRRLNNLMTTSESSPLIYDIMTERYDIKNQIVKTLVLDSAFSGGFDIPSKDPLITFQSIHHFVKHVGGQPLIRPSMFFDVEKQGEGLVDVTTHYIDLVQWIVSSEKEIDIDRDLILHHASRSSTRVSLQDFTKATGLNKFPDDFEHKLNGSNSLDVYSNGVMEYTLHGIPVRIDVKWEVESKDGAGDLYVVKFRTRKFDLSIRPDKNGISSIYIKEHEETHDFQQRLKQILANILSKGEIELIKEGDSYKLVIPTAMNRSHDDHFSEVLQQFLIYRRDGSLPNWEKSFLLAKYYLTTKSLKKAMLNKSDSNPNY